MRAKFILSNNSIFIACIISCLLTSPLHSQNNSNSVSINWDKTISVSKTTPTLQLVENPMVRPSSPIHENTFKALKELGANYVRYVPWFPYPKMAVAELKAPANGKTFWDFTYLDSTMHAFMEATNGHPVVINFSTTPAWMWKTDAAVYYPEDPYTPGWDYNQGTQLRDTTFKEVAGYFARLFSWYTKGGFTDELGKFHKSGHNYKIAYWEVLNEPDLEHNISPQVYTKMYDAIVSELKKISPETKYVGVSLAFIRNPEWFEYFLNPKNHKPGIPLDAISYHHYSTPSWSDQTVDYYQYVFFEKADAFLDKVRYIESIRKRLSPKTITMINEIGSILRSPGVTVPIPNDYWNLSGAMYAYLFLELTKLGIDAAGESQLVGYPSQFPDVSMMDWTNAKPNARYWVLKLLIENFGPGDKLVSTSWHGGGSGQPSSVSCQAWVVGDNSNHGIRKILFINHLNQDARIELPAEVKEVGMNYVDVTTGENPPGKMRVMGNVIILKPFSVAVVTIN
jgi:hypothetical protein